MARTRGTVGVIGLGIMGGSFARNLPWILGYELLALGHVLLRERFLWRGYVEAARLAPRVWRKRPSLSSA